MTNIVKEYAIGVGVGTTIGAMLGTGMSIFSSVAAATAPVSYPLIGYVSGKIRGHDPLFKKQMLVEPEVFYTISTATMIPVAPAVMFTAWSWPPAMATAGAALGVTATKYLQDNDTTWNETAHELYDTAIEIAKEAGSALKKATSVKEENLSEESYH